MKKNVTWPLSQPLADLGGVVEPFEGPNSPFCNLKLDKSCCCKLSLRCQYPALCHQRAVWWVWYMWWQSCSLLAFRRVKNLMEVSWVFIFCSACDPHLAIKDERRWASSSGTLCLKTGFGTISFTLFLLIGMFTVWSTQAACLSPKSAL